MSSEELPERSGAAASVFPAGDSKDAILLQEVSTSLRSNLEIKDRRSFLRTHSLCFVGSEAVSFLVSAGHAPTRDAAVSLGQRLLCNQFIRGLSNSDGAFLDNSHLFRFLEDEATPVRKAAVSTTRPSPRPSSRIRPPASAFRGIYSGGRSWIESSFSSSSYRVQQKNRSMDGYDPWYHHDEIASSDAAARTQSLVDEQRAARLRKSSFCPIESILAVAPTSTVGFSATCSFYFSPHTTHHSIALTVPIVTAMKTAFSSHNMHARETSVHMLRNQVLKAADASDKNWMYLKNITGHHGNDVRIFCRTAAGGVQTVLTVGPVHVAPSTFVQHFLDPSERRKMDALFESSQTVEDLLMAHRRRNKLKQNTAYVHEVFSRAAAAPWVDEAHPIPDEVAWAVQPSEAMAGMYPEGEKQQHMASSGGRGKTDGGVQRVLYRTMASPSAVLSARDFVTFQDCFSMDNGAHCVYEISVEHRDIPSKMEHYTRGEVLCLAHIAEPIPGNPNASMLTVVTQVGLKGKMPSFVAKLIFDQLIARSFDAQTCGLVVDGASQMETSLRDVPYDRTVPDDLVRRSTGVSTLDDERDAATGPKVGLDDFELLAVLGRGYVIIY
ncbi:hypothetical protein DYB28_001043 [Aphanomyces astaci]|uniref:DEP domain-containing protein n=4 Tax=Aphanomyces astaci TaxID=112090 RepID=A0A9X8E2H8_APHAT|nr:hypothetical protein DYB28_001043 [Aphanomyces astaci]